MNDHELFELMRREAEQAPMGDGNDLRRGRARLRRRRVVTGGSGVAGVELAALVGGYLPGTGTGAGTDSAPAPATTSPDSHHDLEELADRTGRAVTEAMDDYTRVEDFGYGQPKHGLLGGQGLDAEGRIKELNETYWYQEWHEAGGVGFLQVNVSRGFDDQQVPPEWFQSCARHFAGWVGPSPEKYDDCDHQEVDGQPVLVGVERRDDRLWFLVKYLREDGVVVEAGFHTPYLKTDEPVLEPSLTTDQLVDVVTDPGVRLYLD